MKKVSVIGAGLAGAEAAWQIAERGVPVTLYEMKPARFSPAHKSESFAELVCSNSFRADGLMNAVGVLKAEMRLLNGLIINAAAATKVPAGGALAVDREAFSRLVTEKIASHPLITVKREEVCTIDETDGNQITIIATGPLTDGAILDETIRLTDADSFYFYDAAAPIVTFDSIDLSKAYFASRYGKGDKYDYLNCPLSEAEYHEFYNALTNAERAPLHEFEKEIHFEGCMPVEAMAERGFETLLFGPLKPVGLENPQTNERPFAVVQLRRDNAAGTLYNIVGFQTNLKWLEQRRVFSLIPALKNAAYERYGVMHRNTYINAPRYLLPTYQLKKYPNVFFAGQITGVEGYLESASSGLIAGINAARLAKDQQPLVFPSATAHGAAAYYITAADPSYFQPMNVTFGIMDEPAKEAIAAEIARLKETGTIDKNSRRQKLKKADKKALMGRLALEHLEQFLIRNSECGIRN